MDLGYGLVAHWPLDGDCDDHSGNGNHGRLRGRALRLRSRCRLGGGPGAAVFDGRSARITGAAKRKSLALRYWRIFRSTAWVNANRVYDRRRPATS